MLLKKIIVMVMIQHIDLITVLMIMIQKVQFVVDVKLYWLITGLIGFNIKLMDTIKINKFYLILQLLILKVILGLHAVYPFNLGWKDLLVKLIPNLWNCLMVFLFDQALNQYPQKINIQQNLQFFILSFICCFWGVFVIIIDLVIILMKSQQLAQRTYKNLCNKSSSKYQYSFGKQQRFKQRILKAEVLDKFYDLPSQISKRGGIFGKQKRDFDTEQHQTNVTSWNYNPKPVKSTAQVVFAPGRDVCKTASMFYTTTVQYPGPGKYNPQKPERKNYVSMVGRPISKYQTISPGPKYNFQSTLLDRNKILSKQKRKGSCRIVLPTNKSRLAMSQASNSRRQLMNSSAEGIVTNKGNKQFGKTGSHAIMPRQQRFKSQDSRLNNPGPGHYSLFSQFIESKKT